MFAVGLAFGIIASVGILFIVQMKAIIRNRTGIEDWIEQKVCVLLNFIFFWKICCHLLFQIRGEHQSLGAEMQMVSRNLCLILLDLLTSSFSNRT